MGICVCNERNAYFHPSSGNYRAQMLLFYLKNEPRVQNKRLGGERGYMEGLNRVKNGGVFKVAENEFVMQKFDREEIMSSLITCVVCKNQLVCHNIEKHLQSNRHLQVKQLNI